MWSRCLLYSSCLKPLLVEQSFNRCVRCGCGPCFEDCNQMGEDQTLGQLILTAEPPGP